MDHQMSAFERYERGLVLKQLQMFYPAIDDFRSATHDPHYAGKAHVQMALCLKSVGRQEEAVLAFRQALATPTLSAEERRHILYHMGQTLESVGRFAESLELYGRIRQEDPGFRDVPQRIKHLMRGGERGRRPLSHGPWPAWMEEILVRGRQLRPSMAAILEQMGQWLTRHRRVEHNGPDSQPTPFQGAGETHRLKRPSRPVRDRTRESRRHVRVPVRLRSHFSSKGWTLSGEGELRDLSPWGCRVTSPVAVPVGADLECCIFPQDAAHPFVIDGATVRWINSTEFGLAFTRVRPGVQREIAQLCKTRAA